MAKELTTASTDVMQTVDSEYVRLVSLISGVCHVESGSLTLNEHEAARWLSPDQLDSVNWLPADLEVIDKQTLANGSDNLNP